jgi:hypothetical protein
MTGPGEYQTAALTILDDEYATFTSPGFRFSMMTLEWIRLGRPTHVTRLGTEQGAELTFYTETPRG